MLLHARHAAVIALLVGPAAVAQVYSTERHRLLPDLAFATACSADLDGDGDLDLVCGTQLLGSRVLWNDGQGRFVAGPSLPGSAGAIATGDIDGDGDLDIAIGAVWFFSYGPGQLFRNDGPLGFTDVSSQWPTTFEAPSDMELVDFDGDGDLDIVTADQHNSAGQVGQPPPINHLYLNDGSGVFTEATAARMSSLPHGSRRMTSGDIDGDGDLDLVFSGALCRVLVQNAAGVAVETSGRVPTLLGSFDQYTDVGLVDFDLDGDLDLLAASGQGVHVFANSGAGFFTLANTIPVPGVWSMRIHDLDGDARPDLLGTRYDPFLRAALPMRMYGNTGSGFVDRTGTHLEFGELAPDDLWVFDADGDQDLDLWVPTWPQPRLWFNDGSGALRLAAATDLDVSVLVAAVADLDIDGDLDVAVIEQSSFSSATQVVVVRNDGSGPGLGRQVLQVWRDNARARSLTWIDTDGDGDLDLHVGNVGVGSSPNPRDQLFQNVGGTFVNVSSFRLPITAASTEHAAAGDIDGDGIEDLVLAGSQARLMRGDGVGGFVDASVALPVPAAAASCVAMLDFDGDGDRDLVFGASSWASSGALRVLRNDWPAAFVDVTAALGIPPLQAWSVAAVDVDRDGLDDLLIGSQGTGNGLLLLRATGAGFVDETATRLPTMQTVGTITAQDFDGDGWPDLVCRDRWGDPLPDLRNANGVFSVFQGAWLTVTSYNQPLRPAFADLDDDGDQDLIADFGLLKNRDRDLMDARPPRLGMAGELVAQAHLGDGINPQLVSLLLSDGALPTPVAIPGVGTLRIDPVDAWFAALLVIPATGGEASFSYQVPQQPALLGAEMFAQGLFVHRPSTSAWHLGNLVVLRLRF